MGEAEGGTYLVVQWLRLCTPNAGGLGWIPGQRTRSRMPPLKMPRTTRKITCATTKTRTSQIKFFLFF